ncbi:MAG: Protein YhfA [Chloroflexi bacterium]|nr:Protein YhfA [Chloroflexota bacterium]
MDAKVTWHGGLSFTGTADTGFEVPLGAAPEVGGDNDGFRPMELMALSLAGCTAMDVISILRKKRQEVTDYDVRVHAEGAEEHPRVFTQATIEYHVTGHGVSEKAVVRAMELSAERYCPAQNMLSEIIPIGLKYFIYEEKESGETELVVKGEYVVPEE